MSELVIKDLHVSVEDKETLTVIYLHTILYTTIN